MYASRLSYGELLGTDRSWMLLGTALRMALEMDIDGYRDDQPVAGRTTYREERQAWIRKRVREKLWCNLYILDRS